MSKVCLLGKFISGTTYTLLGILALKISMNTPIIIELEGQTDSLKSALKIVIWSDMFLTLTKKKHHI